MKRLVMYPLLAMLMSMTGICANAQEVIANSDGVAINYSIDVVSGERIVYVDRFMSIPYMGNVVIPEYVTSYGFVFHVKEISSAAFAQCNLLTNVVIPNSVTAIGSQAFLGCKNLTSITIPEHVTSIGEGAFWDCTRLTTVRARMAMPVPITQVTFPNRANQTLYIPAGSKATYEAADVWKEFKQIVETPVGTNIEFADAKVESICLTNWDSNGDGALSYEEAAAVTSLTKRIQGHPYGVNIFENNQEITSFNELQYFTGLTSIENAAFMSCKNLTSIILPNSIKSIGEGAFYNCQRLISVNIPRKVTSIGYNAFGYCPLSVMTVKAENLVPVNDDTHFNKKATLYVPAGSKAAYEAADFWKEFKKIVEIPVSPFIDFDDANVKALCVANWDTNHDGELSYEEAAAVPFLREVDGRIVGEPIFPENKEIWSFDELQYFTGLRNNRLESSSFLNCTNLTSVVIPNTVKSIEGSAFAKCQKLTSVVLPNSLESIGNSAFWFCQLENIILPQTVTNISYYAFEGCPLTSVIANMPVPATIYESTFTNRKNATLWVPAGSKAAYEAADYWKEFRSILELGDSVTLTEPIVSFTAACPLDFSEPVEGLKAYVVSDIIDNKAVLKEVTTAVPAGTGLILTGTANVSYTIPRATTEPGAINNMLVGVTSETAISSDGTYYILKDSEFVKATQGTLQAGEAYLKLDNALDGEVIELLDAATAINDAKRQISDNEVIYNFNGQRVDNPRVKGLYIKNGKKVIKK